MGKLLFAFSCPVNIVIHDGIASYAHFHDAVFAVLLLVFILGYRGNIHVYIIINSLQIEEVLLLPYMDRPTDTKVSHKYCCTGTVMECLKMKVMQERTFENDQYHYFCFLR